MSDLIGVMRMGDMRVGELIRGYCVGRDEWVYGELMTDSGDSNYVRVLAGEGISYEVYRESIGRISPWVQEWGESIYEGDHVVIRHDETESTRGDWGYGGVVLRFGIVVVVDGEFEIELSDGSLMGVSLVESELADMGTRMMMTVDRNEYELSQSYYMLTVSGYAFGNRGGVEFEDHMDSLTFKIDRDEWGTERVYQALAKGFSELGAEISEEGRYRVLMCSQSSVTVRDDLSGDDTLYYSVSLDVEHLGYTYVFENFQSSGYKLLHDLGLEDYVFDRFV